MARKERGGADASVTEEAKVILPEESKKEEAKQEDSKLSAKGSEEPKTSGKKKEEPKADANVSSFSVEKKIEQILASNLPEAEKEAYIRRLTGDVSKGEANRVPFTVYANIKKIKQERRSGMLKHKGANIKAATMQEWDEIFKDF